MTLSTNYRKTLQNSYNLSFSQNWHFFRTITVGNIGLINFRGLTRGDVDTLEEFRNQLGKRSRRLFAPYPWHDQDKMRNASARAITRHLDGLDFAGIAEIQGLPVASFALWGLIPAKHVNRHTLVVPTLGVAVADPYQLQGIGTASVAYLKHIARILYVDAIELTTTKDNVIAEHVYIKCGFKHQGSLTIPLGIEPSRPIEECVDVQNWRAESYMLCPINRTTYSQSQKYCKAKMRQHVDIRQTPI